MILADDRANSRAALGFAELSIQLLTLRCAWVHVPGRPLLGCLVIKMYPRTGIFGTRMMRMALKHVAATPVRTKDIEYTLFDTTITVVG